MRLPVRLLLVGVLLLVPQRVFAAGGEEADVSNVVLLFTGIAVAYLLAHFFVDRLQQRFLVLSGAEYILLGLFLGRIGLLDDLTGILPLIALAAGWVGLLRGMEMDSQHLMNRHERTLRLVFLHHVVPGVLVGCAAYWFLWTSDWGDYFFGHLGVDALPWRTVAASCFMLGCCAASDSAEPFDLLMRRYHIEGELTARLRALARFGDFFVILVFGAVFCVFHLDREGAELSLSAAEWFLVQVSLGVVLGALFTPFLGGNESPNGRFLALTGIITFASGSAYFLNLSPLAVNLALGMVLVNVARTGPLMRETLHTTEKPMTLMLLVLAGALWRMPPLIPTLVAILGFVLLRTLGKAIGSRVAAAGVAGMRNDLYRGFLSHGEVTLAMAVSFQVVFDGPVVDLVYTVVLVSEVAHDIVAPRILRGLLVDAGEVRRERRQPLVAEEGAS